MKSFCIEKLGRTGTRAGYRSKTSGLHIEEEVDASQVVIAALNVFTRARMCCAALRVTIHFHSTDNVICMRQLQVTSRS